MFKSKINYEKLSQLDEGTGGTVDVVRNLESTGPKIYALKNIDPNTVDTINEICINNKLVGTVGIVTPKAIELSFDDKLDAKLIMDKYDANLSTLKLSHEQKMLTLFKILIAMDFMCAKNVIHRDLKPVNILCNFTGSKDDPKITDIGLIDFGLSISPRKYYEKYTNVQTFYWKAPEILLDAEMHDMSIDMWSLGMIALELLLDKKIFDAVEEMFVDLIQLMGGLPTQTDIKFDPSKIYYKKEFSDVASGKIIIDPIKHWKHLIKISQIPNKDDVIDFLDGVLVYNPNKRKTPKELLLHKCFAGIIAKYDNHQNFIDNLKIRISTGNEYVSNVHKYQPYPSPIDYSLKYASEILDDEYRTEASLNFNKKIFKI